MERNKFPAIFIIWFILLFLTAIVYAQITVTKGPVDVLMKVAWDMPAGITLADVPVYEPRLKDSVGPVTTPLLNVSCVVPSGTLVSCTSPITSSLATQLNKLGTHSLTLSLFKTDTGVETDSSLPFTLVTPPAAPTNFKIIK